MSLISRMTLVLVVVCAAFALTIILMWRHSRSTIDRVVALHQEAHAEFLTSAMRLQGTAIEGVVGSYSWWDDMVAFMAAPDPTWASNNVDNIVGIPNGGEALWVLTPELVVVHSIDIDSRRPPLPFRETGPLRDVLVDNYTFNFFTEQNGQLWQIYGAAIQDPSFWRHETDVKGYLLLGKRWDETWRARLSTLAQARISIRLAGSPGAPPATGTAADAYQFTYPITGLNNQPIATLFGRFDGTDIDLIRDTTRRQLIVATIVFMGTLALLASYISITMLRPLGRITRSLEARNPTYLLDLIGAKNDFGEIARLLSSQFRQGRMLRDEISRRFTQVSPEAVQLERESNTNLRLQLASDLHDGPLQSLYAAGLKISGLEARLTSGEAPTAIQLQELRQLLSGCTSDLRNLLLDLEPQDLQDEDLENALQRLERYMLSVSRKQAKLEIQEGVLDGIDRSHQRHAYYIARELVSNASRHARPQRTHLSFSRRGGFLVIDWENDGFTAKTPLRPGNGLRNIGIRVQQLDGTWTYRVARGPVWHVHIELPFSTLVTDAPISPALPPSTGSNPPM